MNVVYLITTTDGFRVRVSVPMDVDPTNHPSLAHRVLDVETLGLEGVSLV